MGLRWYGAGSNPTERGPKLHDRFGLEQVEWVVAWRFVEIVICASQRNVRRASQGCFTKEALHQLMLADVFKSCRPAC